MPRSDKTHHFGIIITIIVMILLVSALGVLLYNMFVGNESYESTGEKRTAADILCCTYDKNLETIFEVKDATAVEHKIKITFTDGKPDEIMYTLAGEFTTNADSNSGRLWHTEYNLYMGNHNLAIDDLENHFSLSNNRAWANLYTKFGKLNSVTAPLFFIPSGRLAELTNTKMQLFAKMFRDAGFECTLNQNSSQ